MSVHRTDTTCFDDDVLRSPSPVLVEFTADWCGPCRMMAPVLDQVADERAQSLRVVQVDTDADPALSIRFNILGLPTMAVFRDGQMVASFTGARSKATLLQQIDKALG
jgi:thioredoxin 1